jgi:hypothetical protein
MKRLVAVVFELDDNAANRGRGSESVTLALIQLFQKYWIRILMFRTPYFIKIPYPFFTLNCVEQFTIQAVFLS